MSPEQDPGDFRYQTRVIALALMVGSAGGLAVPATAEPAEGYGAVEAHAYPREVLFGDTHVHTELSGDAFALGTRLGPEEAYRFAKGEKIRATGGSSVRLQRPLDFLLIADHAENLGVVRAVAVGDERLPDTPARRKWSDFLAGLAALEDVLNAESGEEFDAGNQAMNQAKAAWQADYGVDEAYRRTIWRGVIEAAERHNAPGRFTTFAGFEWTGRAPYMIHRNVLFADGPDVTSRVLPFSRFDSDDVEALWAYLGDYEQRLGGRAIAIPHNPNLSGGLMFSPMDQQGRPLSRAYAEARARWEPLLEVTQIKGDSEAHPLLSPDDAFADFETWPGGAAKGQVASDDPHAWARQSYARSALQLGLAHRAALGLNPFKFGLIGSTDSHTALATADEGAFWGKMGLNEPSRYRAARQSIFSATGYAAVWALENTRQSIFEALLRRETYATTGPRINVRFFGGWDFVAEDRDRPDLVAHGYGNGVPMGSDLSPRPPGGTPTFLLRAIKDVDGANLERVQVAKGWRASDGTLGERVYDVALSDGRVAHHSAATPLASTVDVETATYSNEVGAAVLTAVWEDPDFDPEVPAFYYLRAIEIETPRWTAYDARYYGLEDLPDDVPMTVRDRAYTSPIWYAP
jgi:hypothetical protein